MDERNATTSLDAALAALGDLLPRLPASDTRREEARALLADVGRRWPALNLDVVSVPDPARRIVEYDVLLDHPSGGTLSVSYSADAGLPWTARFAEKWAPYKVATVNGVSITLHDALLALKLRGREQQLFDRMIATELVRQAAVREGLVLEGSEVEEAMEAFRGSRGLEDAERLTGWLAQHELTPEELRAMIAGLVLERKFRARIVAGRVERYFAENRERFDRAILVRVTTEGQRSAEDVVARAGNDLLASARAAISALRGAGIEAQLLVAQRRQLGPGETEAVFAARPGDILGPFAARGPTGADTRYAILQLLDFQLASLDADTRGAIEDALIDEWLDEERGRARIVWHLT